MLTLKQLDTTDIKKDFPIFQTNKPLIYVDNAATSQKPKQVLESINKFYENHNANVNRGIYQLSENATQLYEEARKKVANLINSKPQEIIFTSNTTEAINTIAYSYGLRNIKQGDNVVISIMEHHSNFVPWQQICKLQNAELRIIDIDDNGQLNMSQLKQLVDEKTKFVAITHISNVLGTINDIPAIAKIAHENNSLLLVDAAQSVPHMPVDVKQLDCDFLTFSGHKMLGPTGIGVLYGKEELLNQIEPFLFGGGMISQVTKEETAWAELPQKFEAGTPNVAGAIGLAAAIDYLNNIGMEAIQAHEKQLVNYTTTRLQEIPGITVYGQSEGGIISFNVKDIHPHDLATIAASSNVCIRAGHHCCQPLMKRLGVAATTRVSFYLYNTKEDVDKLYETIKQAQQVFQ
jgi:cysteine desulfurase / selenocysteine lyase